MINRSVVILWVLVFGNALYGAESVLKTTFIEDLCYSTKSSVIDLRYETTGILMSVTQRTPIGGFNCEVVLSPPKGNSVVLSIYTYDINKEDLLTIEDSDHHMIALMGWGIFKDEKKSIISEGKISIRYKVGNRTAIHPRTRFQFTYTKVSNSPCASNEFKCSNGKCLLKDNVCDGHNHCGDLSDQKKCASKDSDLSDFNIARKRDISAGAIWIYLIIGASVILLIVIIVFIVVLVRRAKLKKAIASSQSASRPTSGGNIPLQSLQSPAPHAIPANNLQPSAPALADEPQRNSFYDRVRRSLRGNKGSSVEGIPKEQARSESYQVPSMYPSLDHQTPSSMYPSLDHHAPSTSAMYGVENPEFRIEE